MPTVSLAPRPVLSAYEQVAQQLIAMIVSGELQAGQRLPNEAELAGAFGVSRPTVREALRVLSARQLIRTTKGSQGGSVITVPTVAHVASVLESSLSLLARGDDITLDELLEARELLEVPAARQAAARRTPESLHVLTDALPDATTARSRQEQFDHNREFHSAVLVLCGNRMTAIATEPIFAVLQRHLARSRLGRELQRGIEAQHRQIADAIAAGDEDGAAREMHAHLEFLRPRYEQAWERRPAALPPRVPD